MTDDRSGLHGRGGLGFGLRYPFERGWRPLLVAAMVTVASVLLFPAVLLLGYTVRVGRHAATGRRLPRWRDWPGLVVDGFRFLGFLVLLAVGMAVAVGIPSLVHPVAGLLAALLVAYAFHAPIAVYFGTGSVRETAASPALPRLLRSRFYLRAMGIFVVLVLTAYVLMLVAAVTVVGVLLAVPYFYFVQYGSVGYLYYRADEGDVL